MKIHQLRVLISAALVGGLFVGCRSDVDVSNIDTRSELELGIALPIGSMSATLGDFVGKLGNNIYIDSTENRGVITWKDTFHIARDYHQLDLAAYIPSAHLNLNVYDKLDVYTQIGDNRQVTGLGIPVTLDFPLTVKLNGINHPDSIGKERLDSALIEVASFASTIRTKNNLPLQWEWIDRVTLDLGTRVHRPAGNTMVVYDKTDPNFSQYNAYGQRVETNVDNFSIVLMKNLHPTTLPEYVTNVVDSVQFMVHFTFTIPNGQVVNVPKDAGFDYQLDVQFLTYKAIWGMFEPSAAMHDEALVDLAESWGDLEFLTKSSLPFSNPKVFVDINTQVAGAMRIRDAYIFSVDMNNTRHYAAFGANEAQTKTIDFQSDQWLPLTSAIGDSTTNMNVEFNKTSDGGRIDRLFTGIPKQLGYRFNVEFNQQTTPQIRITPNTSVRVNAIATLPLMFNQGLHLEYNDTLKDINISQASIDSLVADVEFIDTVKTSDLKLVLKAKNTIPLDVYASIRFLDENNNVIMDPDDPTKPMLLMPQDTFRLVAPTYEYTLGNWNIVKEGETTIVFSINKRKMDMLPKIKAMTYSALIDDRSLDYAYKKGIFNVKLTEDAGIKFAIGLSAKAAAIFDWNNNNQQ